MNNLKRILLISIILLVVACNNKPEESSIKGTIKNLPPNITEIVLRTENNIKTIKIENGIFNDTINIDSEFAYLQIGTNGKTLFLNKKTNLIINADFNAFNNTIHYDGPGKIENNYLNQREQITTQVFEKLDSINKLTPDQFNVYVDNMVNDVETLLKNNADIDSVLATTEQENLTLFTDNIKKQYNTVNSIGKLKKGDPSPTFTYDNYKGGVTSLSDLKGSYVYIDLWATWCPPCKAEIPFLKELEDKFHDKNIKFVSISVDNPNAKNKWKKMISDKKMGGIQLFANGDNNFTEAYEVTGIPRFILLDTKGKILDDNAVRPSNPQLEEILIDLLK